MNAMVLQLGALRDALIEAGASPEKASAAAEELASYENRLASMDFRLTKMDGRLNTLTWMIGFVGAVVLANTALVMSIAAKLFSQ